MMETKTEDPQILFTAGGGGMHGELQCEFCGKAFALKSNLVVHRRIHTGDKPYECPTCHRAFSARASFRAHMRSHSNERPCACDICNKSFKDKAALRRHEATRSHLRALEFQGASSSGASAESGQLKRKKDSGSVQKKAKTSSTATAAGAGSASRRGGGPRKRHKGQRSRSSFEGGNGDMDEEEEEEEDGEEEEEEEEEEGEEEEGEEEGEEGQGEEDEDGSGTTAEEFVQLPPTPLSARSFGMGNGLFPSSFVLGPGGPLSPMTPLTLLDTPKYLTRSITAAAASAGGGGAGGGASGGRRGSRSSEPEHFFAKDAIIDMPQSALEGKTMSFPPESDGLGLLLGVATMPEHHSPQMPQTFLQSPVMTPILSDPARRLVPDSPVNRRIGIAGDDSLKYAMMSQSYHQGAIPQVPHAQQAQSQHQQQQSTTTTTTSSSPSQEQQLQLQQEQQLQQQQQALQGQLVPQPQAIHGFRQQPFHHTPSHLSTTQYAPIAQHPTFKREEDVPVPASWGVPMLPRKKANQQAQAAGGKAASSAVGDGAHGGGLSATSVSSTNSTGSGGNSSVLSPSAPATASSAGGSTITQAGSQPPLPATPTDIMSPTEFPPPPL